MKKAIKEKLLELNPGVTVYDEDIPLTYDKPSFLITLTIQSHVKLINARFKNLLSFDITYYSNAIDNIKNDCISTGEILLREFDQINGCRILNKKAQTIEEVLHFTFDIQYFEMKEEIFAKMQEQQTNTTI